MPKDSHLLTPTSRALLRAARAGCIYIRHAPKESTEEVKEPPTDAEDQQPLHMADRSFVARKWSAVPRHLEPPEMEFLAKRRPGLPSLYGAAAMGIGGYGEGGAVQMRKTRFKKVDPTTGNISIYEAWVPEGHKIEGEVTEDVQAIASANSEVTVTPETPAPGTVVDGVGVVNSEGVVIAEAGSAAVMTPPKRRPPPPKRKGKGIGRGRRKKVMFAPGEGADASIVHGTEAGPAEGTATGVVKEEGADTSRASVDQSAQDEEEEEEGDEGDESDGDESMMDTKTPETPLPQATAEATDNTTIHEPTADPVETPIADPASHVPPDSTTASELHPQPQEPPQTLNAPEASPQMQTDIPTSTIPATVEKKENDEHISSEDVNMTDYHPPELPAGDNMTTAPQLGQAPEPSAQEVVTNAPESDFQPPVKETTPHEIPPATLPAPSTEQTPPNEETQSQLETVESELPKPVMDQGENAIVDDSAAPDQAPVQEKADELPSEQVPNQAIPAPMDEGVDSGVNAGNPETVAETTTDGEQHGEQGKENPTDRIGENVESEAKKEAGGQTTEDVGQQSAKQPVEQVEQPIENTIEQAGKPSDEPTAEQSEQPLPSSELTTAQTIEHTPDETTQGQEATAQPETQPQVLPPVQQTPDIPVSQSEPEQNQSSVTKSKEQPPVISDSPPSAQTSVQPNYEEGKEKRPELIAEDPSPDSER